MKSPLGKNEIRKFLSTAVQKAGLQKKGKQITNHSVRKLKRVALRLLDADIPENFVARLSGHKTQKVFSLTSRQAPLIKEECR